MLSKTSLDFISDMGVTDHRHYVNNIENKIENHRLQESFLKNWAFLKLKTLNFMAPFYGWGSTASRLELL